MALTGSGKNALIYISGTAFTYGNQWTIDISKPTQTFGSFGDSWKSAADGIKEWSGSIAAWHDQDGKVLKSMVEASGSVAVLIYPVSSDATTYYSGNAIFASSNNQGAIDAVVSESANFTGNGTLTMTGFAA